MDASIRQILDPRVLTSAYSQRPALRPTPLTDAFFVNPEPIDGDTFRLLYDPADSEPAPANFPGAEARTVTTGDAQERVLNLFLTFNKTQFTEDVLNALREPDSFTLQQKGRREIQRVMDKFSERQRRFKELVIAKALATGAVHLNAQGQVLETAVGAAMSAGFDVASTHQGNLDGLLSDLFSDPAADIPAMLEALDDAAESENVPPPTDVWVNKLALASLRNNAKFQTWAQYNESATGQVLRGGMIEGLWGKTWHFIGTKYRAVDGSMQPFLPVTTAVFTPPPGEPWMKASSGSTVLPRSIGVMPDIDAALGNLDVVYGPFSYAKLLDDPVRVMGYLGDKFGFHFAEPNAVWQATAFA